MFFAQFLLSPIGRVMLHKKSNIKAGSNMSGSVMAELALSLPVFLMLFILGADIIRLVLTSSTLTSAVERSARFAQLGFDEGDVQAVKDTILDLSGFDELDKFKMCAGGITDCTVYSRGSYSEWFYIYASKKVKLLFGGLEYSVTAHTFAKNEPRYGRIPEVVTSGGGSGGGSGCFHSDTPITMADGSTRPIKMIKIGDKVLAYDEIHNSQVVADVIAVMPQRVSSEFYILNHYIKVTATHPFYVGNTWKSVKDLKVGDMFRSSTGEMVPLNSIELIQEQMEIYNFTVDEVHTYYAHGILVHNKNENESQVQYF